MYKEILEKFCEAFSLKLVFSVNDFNEKTCALHCCLDDGREAHVYPTCCSIVNRMFRQVFSSVMTYSNTDSEEEVCQRYIAFILGCDVFDTCILASSDRTKNRKKVTSVPETLEELEIMLDLASVEKAAS